MKYIFSIFTLFYIVSSTIAQDLYNEKRYRNAIFSQVTVTNNVQYSTAPQWVWPYWNEDLKLNVYQPTGDAVTKRPLIIFAHAGGFLNGSKDVDDMVALCDSFARKGYVTATIDYRKGFNPLDGESAERAVYRGIQDGKAAVRYFKSKADIYKIDTNFVYFGGMSAGGFITLHVAYMNLESERPASTYGGGTVNNLGCLDCVGGNTNVSSKIRAGLNYWGAMDDTLMIVPNDIPMMLMHGTTDPTVPFEYGQPFGLFTLPYVYGSKPVKKRLQNLGVYHEAYFSNQEGLHMLDGSDNGTFNGNPLPYWYDTILPRTTDFLVKVTKSNPTRLSNDTIVLCHGEDLLAQINGNDLFYHRWTLFDQSGRTVLPQTTKSITLSDLAPGEYDLAVVEFNEVYCASDTIWFHIIQHEEIISTPLSDLNQTVCAGTEIQLAMQENGTNSYLWSYINAGELQNEGPESQISLTFDTSGEHLITVTEQNTAGCAANTVTFTIVQQPTYYSSFQNESEEIICYLQQHIVTANGTEGSTFNWTYELNGEIQQNNERQLTVPFVEPGNYTITLVVTSEMGCIGEPVIYNVTIKEPLSTSFTYLTSNFTTVVFTNSSTNAVYYSWDFGDGTTSTVANPIHTYTSNGTYNVMLTVSNQNGCFATYTQIININHLGVQENELAQIALYPNPVNNQFTIDNTSENDFIATIIDINGKEVVSAFSITKESKTTIDVSSWANGTYFVQLQDSTNTINILKIMK